MRDVPECEENTVDGLHCPRWYAGGSCSYCGAPQPKPDPRTAGVTATPAPLDPRRHTTQCKKFDNNCGAVHPSNCPDCPFRTGGVEGRKP